MEKILHHSSGGSIILKKPKTAVNPYLRKKAAPEFPQNSVTGTFKTKHASFLTKSLATDSLSGTIRPNLDVADVSRLDMKDNQSSVGDLPQAMRLPSHNVTFQPSEILTVSELHMNSKDYINRSIRVTGVISHRHIHPVDGSVCFVLSDPLLAPKSKTSVRSSSELSTPRKHAVPVPASLHHSASSVTKGKLTLSQLGRTSLLATDKTPRRLVHVPKATSTSPHLLGQKRQRVTVTPVDSLLTTLTTQHATLVIADPIYVHVRECGVGDLMMVVGEVQLVEDDAPAKQLLELWKVKKSEQQCASASDEIVYVRPRILRNANGTDMRLQFEALKMRRKHLLNLREALTNNCGRGPPSLRPSIENVTSKKQKTPF